MQSNFNIKNSNVFDKFQGYDFTYQAGRNAQTAVINEEPEDTIEIEEKSDSQKTIFGKTFASGVAGLGILCLIFAKGFHGSAIKQYLGRYTQELRDKSIQLMSKKEKVVLFFKKRALSILRLFESMSNITAIKDSIFDKLCQKCSFGKKFASVSQKIERKMLDRTLEDKYDNIGVLTHDFTSLVRKLSAGNGTIDKNQIIEIKGIKNTYEEWCKILQENATALLNGYTDGFAIAARQARCQERDELLKGTGDKLKEKFLKNAGVFNSSNYDGYATENVTKAEQRIMQEKISAAKRKVTNNVDDVYYELDRRYRDLANKLDKDDNTSKNILRFIRDFLEDYKVKFSGKNEAADREFIETKILEKLTKTKEVLEGSTECSNRLKAELNRMIDDFINAIKSEKGITKKGPLEEIMTILKGFNTAQVGGKKVISDSEFKQLSQFSRGITSGMQEATELEAGAYFLKQAEIEAGSAATDAAAIVLPALAGCYALGKCDNNDERVSSSLKTFVPLVGTLGTFVYGTTKMYSGGKSLVFSGVSGFLLSKGGIYCDDLYKKYRNTGSAVQVAKGEYKDVWQGMNGKHPVKT